MTKAEAECFLTTEMKLLDEWHLEEWLSLFTPDGIYWFPREMESERLRENALIYDEAPEREIRVRHLLLEHLAQTPGSQIIHLSSNIATEDTDRGEEILVRCNVVVYEMRPGGFQGLEVGRGVLRSFPARFAYRLRRSDVLWRIAEKKVVLIARDEPLYNLSFIV